jgi:uncharacterized cupredoxin-like copper-binding protein
MRRIALVVGACLALAGCGGGGSGSGSKSAATTATNAPAAQKAVTISETEYSLTPNVVRLAAPGTVTLKVRNIGHVAHALEVEGHGIRQEIDAIQPGESATLTVDLSKAGSYEMYCPIDGHEAKGMKGIVRVGGSAGMGTEGETTTEDETTTGGTDTSKGPGY